MNESDIRAMLKKKEYKAAKKAAKEKAEAVKKQLKNKEAEYKAALAASNKVMEQLQETKTILAKQKDQLKELDNEIDIEQLKYQ